MIHSEVTLCFFKDIPNLNLRCCLWPLPEIGLITFRSWLEDFTSQNSMPPCTSEPWNGMKSLSPHPITHLNTSRPMGWSPIALHTARCLNISNRLKQHSEFMKGRQTRPIAPARLLHFDQLFQRATVLQTKSYDEMATWKVNRACSIQLLWSRKTASIFWIPYLILLYYLYPT